MPFPAFFESKPSDAFKESKVSEPASRATRKRKENTKKKYIGED